MKSNLFNISINLKDFEKLADFLKEFAIFLNDKSIEDFFYAASIENRSPINISKKYILPLREKSQDIQNIFKLIKLVLKVILQFERPFSTLKMIFLQ